MAENPCTSLTRTEARIKAANLLREAGVGEPDLDARVLVCRAAAVSHEQLVAAGKTPLEAAEAERLATMLERRLGGEPVSRICGAREFYGRAFALSPDTLDPRPDTETLIETVLELAGREGWGRRPMTILDLGTGSGCILATLLAELPLASGTGIDCSGAALEMAQRNAERLGVVDRASFVRGDWLEGIGPASADLIVANPPYIPSAEIPGLAREVREHDPLLALDGGADGLHAYRAIARSAGRVLRPGGHIVLEVGSEQARAVVSLLRQGGLGLDSGTGIRADLAGRPRCVVASLPKALRRRAETLKKGLEITGERASFSSGN